MLPHAPPPPRGWSGWVRAIQHQGNSVCIISAPTKWVKVWVASFRKTQIWHPIKEWYKYGGDTTIAQDTRTHTLTHTLTHTHTHTHTHTLTHTHTHSLTHAHSHTLTHTQGGLKT